MRDKTQQIELDLQHGIVPNAPHAEIGARLRFAQNSVWNYRYPRLTVPGSGRGSWMLRQPLTFPDQAALTFTGAKSFRDIAFPFALLNVTTQAALIGCNTSDQYAMWRASGGAEIPFLAGVPRSAIPPTSRILGCSVTWQTPGYNPATGAPLTAASNVCVFSHPFAQQIYYIFDGAPTATAIRSLTVDVAPTCPTNAAGLAVHLDRLWMLTSAAQTGRPAECWFTDPFNLDAIGPNNVVLIPDEGRGLAPGQFGTIDTSGVPHLIIGCANSVYVLDGDPQFGGGLQADLRALSVGVGVLSSHAMALTPFGVFFLGTDADLWLIPPGCQTMTAVGAPIRNHLGLNNLTGELDADLAPTGSLVWFPPYLYIFPGGETGAFYVAEPAAQGITFWGPVGSGAREAVIAAPTQHWEFHAPSGRSLPSVHSVSTLAVGGTAKYLAFDPYTAPTGTYPNGASVGRSVSLRTGLLTIAGHHVQAIRVVLEVLRLPLVGGAPVTWGVEVFDEHNVSYACTLLGPGSPFPGVYDARDTVTLYFVVPPQPASRGVAVRILGTDGADLGLQRAWVEVHVTPAANAP